MKATTPVRKGTMGHLVVEAFWGEAQKKRILISERSHRCHTKAGGLGPNPTCVKVRGGVEQSSKPFRT